jgi:hypothetical protein
MCIASIPFDIGSPGSHTTTILLQFLLSKPHRKSSVAPPINSQWIPIRGFPASTWNFPANGLACTPFFRSMDGPAEFTFDGGSEFAILKDGETHDVVPAWELTSAVSARKTPWGSTMAGCFAVWCVTLSGLVLIINMKVWHQIKPHALMFASGTLMSSAFALILFESTHLIAVDANEGLAARTMDGDDHERLHHVARHRAVPATLSARGRRRKENQ